MPFEGQRIANRVKNPSALRGNASVDEAVRRWGCACCPADLSASAESPAKFEARPLSGRGSLWVWTSTQPGVASRPSESISRLLGPALPPTCVIKPLSIGYYPRKPRHRTTNDGLMHRGSPARFPLVRMGWCGTTCNRLRCMTPSRNLTARAFRAAVPLVRIHLPPAKSLQTISSSAAEPITADGSNAAAP